MPFLSLDQHYCITALTATGEIIRLHQRNTDLKNNKYNNTKHRSYTDYTKTNTMQTLTVKCTVDKNTDVFH